MKRIIKIMGVLGVVSMFVACSSENTSSTDEQNADATILNSAPSNETFSSSSVLTGPNSNPSEGPFSATSSIVVNDTIVKKDTVHIQTIISAASDYDDPYFSSGIFCWTAGCEVNFPSSSSMATSSESDDIIITLSSAEAEPAVPPTINGSTMIDNRDNHSYPLQTVGGKLWMAQDLNYETNASMCFDNKPENCDTYGRLYTYIKASVVCPEGWRLPNREEAQAAINDESFPWSYSGRCKDGDCNFTEEMGFHWTSATGESGDKNYDQYKSDANAAVIIVEKEPDYAGSNDQKFFQMDSKSKYFSVRCVQGE